MMLPAGMLTDAKRILKEKRNENANEKETIDQQVGLDDTVWPKVFEKYEQFLKDVRFQTGDEELQFTPVTEAYCNGQTAMIRNTAALADNITKEDGLNSVILPYFGDTSEDNWILTYPMCQLAVSDKVEEDEAKKKAVMEILLAIFSEEGQKAVAAGTSVLSYNKEVNISASPSIQYSQEYATEKGLTIVNIGGGIRNTDELGVVEQSIDFLSVNDDVMDICVTCGKAEEGTSMDVTMLATAYVSGSEEVMRLQSDFVLQDMSTTISTTYLYREQTSGEQFFDIEKADVIQTELGTYVDIYYSNTKGDDPADGLSFRIVDQAGKAYESLGGSGVICVENGLYSQRCMLNKCEIGETLYVDASDCLGKEVYGVSELSRE